ncbi:MAG: hypothetical protein LLG37_03925 [Spirochaetia bacterium]|nr:hypothetical protein [Spirochaetia bacterium]
MRVKICSITPSKKKLAKVKLSEMASWEEYAGMTDEQEDFHTQTYMDYISGKRGPKAKRIYVSEN